MAAGAVSQLLSLQSVGMCAAVSVSQSAAALAGLGQQYQLVSQLPHLQDWGSSISQSVSSRTCRKLCRDLICCRSSALLDSRPLARVTSVSRESAELLIRDSVAAFP